jgi:hypothetical protein
MQSWKMPLTRATDGRHAEVLSLGAGADDTKVPRVMTHDGVGTVIAGSILFLIVRSVNLHNHA